MSFSNHAKSLELLPLVLLEVCANTSICDSVLGAQCKHEAHCPILITQTLFLLLSLNDPAGRR